MKTLFAIIATIVGLLLFVGCQSSKSSSIPSGPNMLTHGNVQMRLEKGVTSQNDVICAFGAPNVTTISSDGTEVWTYQKHASVANASAKDFGYWLIFIGGGSCESGFEQSSRTMTLMISFDKDKKVSDFKSFSSSF